MKNITEIKQHIKDVENDDFFGVIRSNLIDFLPFENAKEYLNPEATEKDWQQIQKPLTKQAVYEAINDYLPFAWDKANNCRGLSANRSIDHMKAYLWILGDGNFEKMEEIEYEYYGKEKLIFVSKMVGFDWEKYDNGERTNFG